MQLLKNNLQQWLNFQSQPKVSKIKAVTINDFPFRTFEKSGIGMMLAPMLDYLNLKLTAFNVRARTTVAYQRKIVKTKQTFAGKMNLVKVDWCTRRKRDFVGIICKQ